MSLYPDTMLSRISQIKSFFDYMYKDYQGQGFIELRWSRGSDLSSDGSGPWTAMFPIDDRGMGDMFNHIFKILSSTPHSLSFTPQPRLYPDTKSKLIDKNFIFWTDIDDIAEAYQNQWAQHLLHGMLASYVFRSGNGLHVYWKSSVQMPINTLNELFRLAPYALWSDPNIRRSHLMRIPWSANCKFYPVTIWTKDIASNLNNTIDAQWLLDKFKKIIEEKYPDDYSSILATPVSLPITTCHCPIKPISASRYRESILFGAKKCPLLHKAVYQPKVLNLSEWIAMAFLCFFSGLGEYVFHKISAMDPYRYKVSQAENIWCWVIDKPNPSSCTNVGIYDKNRCGGCLGIGRMAIELQQVFASSVDNFED